MPEIDYRTVTLRALNQRCVLLLGQHFLTPNDKDNPFFAALTNSTASVPVYDWWLQSQLPLRERARLVADAGRATPIADPRLIAMREVPWSCALTSCIDPTPKQVLHIANACPVLELFQRQEHRPNLPPLVPIVRKRRSPTRRP
jgi:hypothetical protein